MAPGAEKVIFVTGMSGTGKTTVLERLRQLGFETVDTDEEGWGEEVWFPDEGRTGWVWKEKRIAYLLAQPRQTPLFLSGTVSNQGKFYPQFDHVVLLSAPTEVMLERVRERTNNSYGKTADQQAEILEYTRTVEPLLRRGADLEIDTAHASASEVAEQLIQLAQTP
ncbi:shikimate kinase [Deinococcus radiophilus]|uniref:shikimate kinase n=1 Tax=Deinococcus radiophilus TaxID=32062 RepID=UPI001E4F4D6F|nr:AAA family ATPase [Deinococcus radiophilus]UFA50209.1 AAA family ATPase [Deinococcus radiophilus]